MTGRRHDDGPLYAALAKLYHWPPAVVDRMSDEEIVAVLKTTKATAPSYAELFRSNWARRQRCIVCDDMAMPDKARCQTCGGALRKLTAAEVAEQWERRKKTPKARRLGRG